MTKASRKQQGELEMPVASSVSELAARMDIVVGLFETKTLAAKTAGISPEQLARQVKGINRPFFETISRLCGAKDISLNWMATGKGQMYLAEHSTATAPIDEILLENLIEGLELYLAEKDLLPLPHQKSRMIVVFYRILSRWREQLIQAGVSMPPDLREPGHPINIATHPILSEVIGLID